jgi:putative ABC transport system permease protein
MKKRRGRGVLYNYLKIAIRNITRYRVFSIVNVLGLAFGIAISIIIYVFVRQELSYDGYHKNHNRIYRVNSRVEAFETSFKSAMTPYLLSETMKNNIPEVEQTTRVLMGSHKKVSYNDRQFSAKRFYYTDPSFFKIFTVPVIKGNPENLLTEEYTIVITEETAERYFGEEDPIGKLLYLDNGWKFRVTGVCENVPVNSHLHFDFLASLKGIMLGKDVEKWNVNPLSTYVMLKEDTKPFQLQDDLDRIAQEKIYPELSPLLTKEISSHKEGTFEFYLQPLTDIHFTTDVTDQFEAGRPKIYLYIFSVLAGIILLIACVNYMNLSTARLSTRAREVALRKVVGASRHQIIIQFLSESVFFSIFATFIALVIIELIARPFLEISGISIDPNNYRHWFLIPILLTGTLIIGILSGSYPSLFLSGFGVIKIMKGGNYRGDRGTRLRGILVLSQFTLSIIMVISSLVIYNQVKYLQKKNLGFNKNNIVVIERAYALGKEETLFKNSLKNNPDILNASLSLTMPGETSGQVPLFYTQGETKKVAYLTEMAADDEFVETMQMHLIQGNNFDTIKRSDKSWQILINESASRELGLEKPVGMKLNYLNNMMKGNELLITGVIKDYNFESLYKEIKPMFIFRLKPGMYTQNLAVRLNGEDIPGSIEYIQKVWKKVTNDEPFDYYFLDKDLDMQYKEEERTAGIFGVFSFLAIFIATLGLFGLAAHTAELRTREISIRKAMGASVSRIALMLLSHFTRWVLWSVLVAFPLAYLAMKLWLGRFAYHINIEIWFFILSAFLAIIIAIITVSFQSLRSAKANPIQALQYE